MVESHKKNVNVKFSQGVLDKIEIEVMSGKYSTPSDFIVTAVHWYLNQEEYRKHQREEIISLIRSDPAIMEEIRESIGLIAADMLRKK